MAPSGYGKHSRRRVGGQQQEAAVGEAAAAAEGEAEAVAAVGSGTEELDMGESQVIPL